MSILWTIWGFLTSRVGQIVAAVGAALMLIWYVYRAGKKEAREEQEARDRKLSDRIRSRVDEASKQAVRDARGMSDDDLNQRLRDAQRLRD